MLYASLKAAHLLGVVVWIGGMFFVLACLRPAVVGLEPAARVGLMHAALRRFLAAAGVAALVVLASGASMIGLARGGAVRSGLAFNMPLDWYVMVVTFFVMLAIYAHIAMRLLPRLSAAVEGASWPAGAAVLAGIRVEVLLNLVLGVFVIVVAELGRSA